METCSSAIGSALNGLYGFLQQVITMEIGVELIERFHEKWSLNSMTGCWEWIGATAGRGYGFIKRPGERKQIYAHRLSWLIHYGEIKDGLHVCHVCDNARCVKPSHLFLGTSKDNMQDMKAKDRHLPGSRNGNAKLSDDKVMQIFNLANQGVSQGEIGRIYGVAQSTVWKILRGQRYANVSRAIEAVKESRSLANNNDYIGGFGLVQTAAANARIVKWDSAA